MPEPDPLTRMREAHRISKEESHNFSLAALDVYRNKLWPDSDTVTFPDWIKEEFKLSATTALMTIAYAMKAEKEGTDATGDS